jgi:hypothetical protein
MFTFIGSYVKTFKNQRRLLKDERVNHRGVMNEYKNFLQNGGFGPTFGATAQQTYKEKVSSCSSLVFDASSFSLFPS